MNKSLITNFISLCLCFIGYFSHNNIVLYAGVFAFSGALTNWLAIHMLFEKIPGLYGSGVIPARFEAIKISIKNLMMRQFFTQENINHFIQEKADQTNKTLDLKLILNQIDFEPSFNSLVDVISNSSFGGMLAMFGGQEALMPLKEPFIEKMQQNMRSLTEDKAVQAAIKNQLSGAQFTSDLEQKIESMIDKRLNELTPKMVKEMVQEMIKAHLGWLVVWGGVFGGLIGILSALIAA